MKRKNRKTTRFIPIVLLILLSFALLLTGVTLVRRPATEGITVEYRVANGETL